MYEIEHYFQHFVQPLPRYGIQVGEGRWMTVPGTLSVPIVMNHLGGKAHIASVGQWYPAYAAIDFDKQSEGDIQRIRQELSLNATNSMLCKSFTEGHFHLFLRPEYKERPPTLRLVRTALGRIVQGYGAELYPHESHHLRLPFGPKQRCVDEGKELLDWQGLLYWFDKLDAYDIGSIPIANYNAATLVEGELSDNINRENVNPSIYREGQSLFQTGLVCPNSRHDSQYKVLYYLWRKNFLPKVAGETVSSWIRAKHNGFSREVDLRNWRIIDKEIDKQVVYIWNTYQRNDEFPDSIQLERRGWTTKQDLEQILVVTEGRRNEAEFLYKLIKYYRPRMNEEYVAVHTRRLIEFSSDRTYLDYLDRLSKSGVLDRRDGYLNGRTAKKIKLNGINPASQTTAILKDGRSPESFFDAVKIAFPGNEVFNYLYTHSIDSRVIQNIMRRMTTIEHSGS